MNRQSAGHCIGETLTRHGDGNTEETEITAKGFRGNTEQVSVVRRRFGGVTGSVETIRVPPETVKI
ncbi:MAG: hypothetical protein BMS9Abin36_1823 [Gammaproteobacteria bacterium]|nr:MAG: hypothetical protein BMS9Abin36_1823 [Gammaproteobacteria bacterium]